MTAPCRRRALMLSFVSEVDHERGASDETCAYWCNGCPFSNAGSRPRLPSADVDENWNDDVEMWT